ncbi:MAG TPA: carboxypeptidase regulatory-like domain-containing protein [Bryobacteraceae bacterium]|nr:carboxypeptidase regulatory-like domain-containing protein [Bryobacteraceae bacterium]
MQAASGQRIIAVYLCLFTGALIASGAETGIAVSGKVVDENGAPVRDVRITAFGSTGQAPISAGSDAAGGFSLQIPKTGIYRIQAECDGYFVFTRPEVDLEDTSSLEIQITHLKELAESVNVNYSPPVIDPEQTSDTKRLNSQQILNIPYPASQDYRNALPLMNGAILDNSNQIHLNGGTTEQANYRLNGFDISDPATGTLSARVNVDTVQALEWDASRFSADKGKGSAGTVDIRTQMGDDHWRFGGTNFIPGLSSQDGWHVNHWSPRVIFSGPIVKGKVWFHNAFDAYYVVSTLSGLPRGQDQNRSVSGSDLTRLQWNVTNTHILTASFLANLGDDTRNGLSFLTPVSATVNRRTSLFVGTIKDQWSVGGGLIEFGFADTAAYLRSAPQGDRPYVITPFGAAGNYFANQSTATGRQEGLVNGFLKPFQAGGRHQIELGVDGEHSDIDQTIFRNSYTTVNASDAIVRSVQFLGSPRQFANNSETYGYALDRWSPRDSLVIEGGFRTQWDEYAGSAPIAPRLAGSWSPKWAGGAKFSAGWGIFYDAITLNMLALSQEQTSISTFYGAGGAASGVPVETQFLLQPHDLRLPRFALTSFSAEKELPWQVFAKVNLISRQGSRGFAFEDELVNPALNLYVLDNIQRQRYRAAEFTFRRTFLSKYQWFASYTRSEARANAVVNYTVDSPILAPQAGGPLPWDAPNRFLAWGWAPIEKGWFPRFLQPIVGETDAQVMIDYHTGFPFSVMNESGNLVGSPNALRFPNYATLNLALERRFPFRGYLWAWRVSLVNALNRANPNVVNSDINSPQFLSYQQGQARAVNVRLRFIGRK